MSKTRDVSTWLERSGWKSCGGNRWRGPNGDYVSQNEAIKIQNERERVHKPDPPIPVIWHIYCANGMLHGRRIPKTSLEIAEAVRDECDYNPDECGPHTIAEYRLVDA